MIQMYRLYIFTQYKCMVRPCYKLSSYRPRNRDRERKCALSVVLVLKMQLNFVCLFYKCDFEIFRLKLYDVYIN